MHPPPAPATPSGPASRSPSKASAPAAHTPPAPCTPATWRPSVPATAPPPPQLLSQLLPPHPALWPLRTCSTLLAASPPECPLALSPKLPALRRAPSAAPQSLPTQCESPVPSPDSRCAPETRCFRPAAISPDRQSCTSAPQPRWQTGLVQNAPPSKMYTCVFAIGFPMGDRFPLSAPFAQWAQMMVASVGPYSTRIPQSGNMSFISLSRSMVTISPPTKRLRSCIGYFFSPPLFKTPITCLIKLGTVCRIVTPLRRSTNSSTSRISILLKITLQAPANHGVTISSKEISKA